MMDLFGVGIVVCGWIVSCECHGVMHEVFELVGGCTTAVFAVSCPFGSREPKLIHRFAAASALRGVARLLER